MEQISKNGGNTMAMFKKNSKDGICAYITGVKRKEISSDFIIIGDEDPTSEVFTGVVILKDHLVERKTKEHGFYTLNIKMSEKGVTSILDTDNSWQAKNNIGVLSITTTIN